MYIYDYLSTVREAWLSKISVCENCSMGISARFGRVSKKSVGKISENKCMYKMI